MEPSWKRYGSPRAQKRSPNAYQESHPDDLEVWDLVQAKLSNEREHRLAYLLYHCGLESAEIMRCYPQEWSDVHEVTSLRRIILERLISSNYT